MDFSRKFEEDYTLGPLLGTGSTSTCHLCYRKRPTSHRSQSTFACKIIDKNIINDKYKGLLEQFEMEITLLKALRHPNIIHLEDVFHSSTRIHMVMEYMQGGELFDYIVKRGYLNELEASGLVFKISSAIAYMHENNIVHRDLKPENLLLTKESADAEVKIIDFGLSKVMETSTASSYLGTKGYLAPEIMQRNSYTMAIDCWALGVIVFVLLCGCLPFGDDAKIMGSQKELEDKFVLRFPRWGDRLSKSAKHLLRGLLELDPKKRLTAAEVLDHPWVRGQELTNSLLESPKEMRKILKKKGHKKQH